MKPNVGFFSIATHLGGAERSLLDFLKHTTIEKSRLHLFVPKASGPLLDELTGEKIRIHTVKLPTWLLGLSRKKGFLTFLLFPLLLFFLPWYLFKISREIEQKNIKIVHSTGLKFHFLLMIISLVKPELTFNIHLRDILKSSVIIGFFSLFSKRGNIHFIANSQVTARSVPKIRWQIIYNGFDANQYNKMPSNIREQLGIPDTKKLIAIIGAIAEWKGQQDFIEVALHLLNFRDDVHFLVIGDEIYDTHGELGELKALKTMVENQNQQEHIQFLGFQKDLVPFYSDIDLLVHCSRRPEPFGRVIVEAMLCECAVIASNQGGPLEIIQPQRNGLLHPPKNLELIEANICQIIDSLSLRKSLGDQARKDALKFDINNYVTQLEGSLAPGDKQSF